MKKKAPEYWDALTKDKLYKKYIKTDFAKFCEEDDPEYTGSIPIAGEEMGMGAGGMMGGMGDLDGMDMNRMMAKMGAMGAAGEFGDEVDADLADLEPDSLPPPLEESVDPASLDASQSAIPEDMEEVD